MHKIIKNNDFIEISVTVKLPIFIESGEDVLPTDLTLADTKLSNDGLKKKIVYLLCKSHWDGLICSDEAYDALITNMLELKFDIVDQSGEPPKPIDKVEYRWGE